MKKLLIAATALSLLGGTAALAQPGYDRGYGGYDRGYNGYNSYNGYNGYDRDRDRGGYDRDHRYDRDRRDDRGYGYGYGRGVGRDVYAPGHRWVRGGYLPREYWGGRYVVNDWRAYRLHAPPRGYHWVRVGNDYVLAAIATGLIAELMANNY